MFSPYQRVPEGSYTVAMRLAGAPSTEPAVLSTTVQVGSDAAATVAGMGQNSELRLVTLTDDLDAPAAGQSKLRVIQAAMTAPEVDTVTLGDTVLASDLEFTAATDYGGVPSGSAVVRVDAPGSTAEQTVELAAGSTYTVVVRDLAGGLGVLSIQDFAAAGQTPTGGVDAGLGGSVMAPSTTSWTVAGVTVVAAWLGGLLDHAPPTYTGTLSGPSRASRDRAAPSASRPADRLVGCRGGGGMCAACHTRRRSAHRAARGPPERSRIGWGHAIKRCRGPAGHRAGRRGADPRRAGAHRHRRHRGLGRCGCRRPGPRWHPLAAGRPLGRRMAFRQQRAGDRGPAVMVGHVDSLNGPAVFIGLDNLRLGDVIDVEGGDGTIVSFAVSSVTRHPKDAFPTEAVYGPTPDAELRLLTCGGPFDRDSGYADNVVVAATAID